MFLLNHEVEFKGFLETPFGVVIVGTKKNQSNIFSYVYLYRDGCWREKATYGSSHGFYKSMTEAEEILGKLQ